MRITALALVLALLLTLSGSSLLAAAVSTHDALVAADALVTRVAAYSANSPDAAGAFEPWRGRSVEPEAALLVHSYPALEPSYYYVRLTSDNGGMSFVTIGAVDGEWHAYGEIGGSSTRLVNRREATAALASSLEHALPENDARIVSMPDKRLYWHAGTPGGDEAFVELADASNIHIGLDETISPQQPEFPEPHPESDLRTDAPRPSGEAPLDRHSRYPTSYDITSVPHYYQVTDWNCGPAASEMVMD